MEKKIANKIIYIVGILVLTNIGCKSKNQDYYQFGTDGNSYPKLVRYILKGALDNIKEEEGKLTFYIGNDFFEHNPDIHEKLVLDTRKVKKLNIVTTRQLVKDKTKEHQRIMKLDSFYFPTPTRHYNLKVFVVVKNEDGSAILYEADLIPSIS